MWICGVLPFFCLLKPSKCQNNISFKTRKFSGFAQKALAYDVVFRWTALFLLHATVQRERTAYTIRKRFVAAKDFRFIHIFRWNNTRFGFESTVLFLVYDERSNCELCMSTLSCALCVFKFKEKCSYRSVFLHIIFIFSQFDLVFSFCLLFRKKLFFFPSYLLCEKIKIFKGKEKSEYTCDSTWCVRVAKLIGAFDYLFLLLFY